VKFGKIIGWVTVILELLRSSKSLGNCLRLRLRLPNRLGAWRDMARSPYDSIFNEILFLSSDIYVRIIILDPYLLNWRFV
jgi:hypothetical protein